jgi:hypothetical protein
VDVPPLSFSNSSSEVDVGGREFKVFWFVFSPRKITSFLGPVYTDQLDPVYNSFT